MYPLGVLDLSQQSGRAKTFPVDAFRRKGGIWRHAARERGRVHGQPRKIQRYALEQEQMSNQLGG